jgi:hypothetical protein
MPCPPWALCPLQGPSRRSCALERARGRPTPPRRAVLATPFRGATGACRWTASLRGASRRVTSAARRRRSESAFAVKRCRPELAIRCAEARGSELSEIPLWVRSIRGSRRRESLSGVEVGSSGHDAVDRVSPTFRATSSEPTFVGFLTSKNAPEGAFPSVGSGVTVACMGT